MIHGGRDSLTQAVQEGVAAWGFDHDTVIRERVQGVRYLGVQVKETGAVFLTALSAYENRELYRALNFTRSGGSVIRCVRFEHFVTRPGALKKL